MVDENDKLGLTIEDVDKKKVAVVDIKILESLTLETPRMSYLGMRPPKVKSQAPENLNSIISQSNDFKSTQEVIFTLL